MCYMYNKYKVNNYKEYKLKWSRIIIIWNMYTICITNMYNMGERERDGRRYGGRNERGSGEGIT